MDIVCGAAVGMDMDRPSDMTKTRTSYIQTYIQTYRHTNIQTYKQTYIHTYRHTDRQTYRQTDIQTYKHTNKHTYLPTYIHTYTTYIQLTIRTKTGHPSPTPQTPHHHRPQGVGETLRSKTDPLGGAGRRCTKCVYIYIYMD